jgi:hypothetical protein
MTNQKPIQELHEEGCASFLKKVKLDANNCCDFNRQFLTPSHLLID